MIGNAILEFDDLRKLSGLGEHARMATVARWAEKQGIRYKCDGHGGIWTTIDAVNAALGLDVAKSGVEPYRDGEIF